MSKSLRQESVEKIIDAFRNSEYPKDDIGDSTELYRFKDKAWNEISVEELDSCPYFGFFSKPGLRYFLPAYLTLTLLVPDKVSTNIHHALARDLGNLDELLFRSREGKFCDLFTSNQKEVILEFIKNYTDFFPWPTENLSPFALKMQSQQRLDLEKAQKYWEAC